MRAAKALGLIGLSLAVVACKPSGEAPPSASASGSIANPPAATSVVQPASTTVQPITIWFEPAMVSACDKAPVKVMVHWNARSVADVKSVEVRPIGPGGKESLFVHGGPLGNRETGEWMTAGRQMVLRNHDNGLEIGRAKLEGAPCASPTAAQPTPPGTSS